MPRTRPPEAGEAGTLERLPALLATAGIQVGERGLKLMHTHFELLVRWNRKINLTAIRDPGEILRRHFLESLFLTKVLKLDQGVLYDIGSGAGFPGLPLKAAHPELKLVLVESSLKKAVFLKEVIRVAGLEGARVETTRAELLVERAGLEPADWVTLRAVGQIDKLLPVLRRLLVSGGQAALFLGERDAAEITKSAWGFAWKPPVRIPDSERRVILVGAKQAG